MAVQSLSRLKQVFRVPLMTATLMVGLAGSTQPAHALDAPCEYRLGFKTIHDELPDVVGSCLDNESYNATGDSVQHSTGGLLAWRHADNWTAFTDGYHTWVNGPYGLQERLNTDRFPWEHDLSGAAGQSAGVTSSSSVTSVTHCTAVARSGDVAATGLRSSTTIVTDGTGTHLTTAGNGTSTVITSSDGNGTSTTVITNSSSSTSSPGSVAVGC